ncbi:MAG: PepSY domain-containing protein [Candidatus Manganitrophus sp.]|nr:MAG: PepSY domain-containing protein [Candidatus Manganitrophus sp.]
MISRSVSSQRGVWFNVSVFVVLILILSPGAGLADGDHDRAKQLKEAGEILSLEQVIERAKRDHPGQLLEAELEEKKGRFIYELELLDQEGIVWELKYDAKSGELLKEKREH